MRVSVIIPAFNEERNLSSFLPAVLSQIGPHDEVVVVDNGSKDLTGSVARSFGVSVIHEPVRGRSRARNTGIRCSKGHILAFLDADCMPAPEWFKNLLDPFEDPKIGCVAGQILNQEVATQFGQYLKVKGHLSQDSTLHHGFLPYAQTGNVAFRREVFDRVGVFDEALWSGHDADLCWRMQLETSLGIVFAPSAAVYHAQDLSLRAFLRQKRRHANGAVLLYKKYRRFRGQETCSLKKTYWEYRSIATRTFRYVARTLVARFGLASHPPSDQGYQLLMEIGEKIGRIEGSIRNRIWYP